MCISWSLLCPFIPVSIPVPHQAAYRATNRRIKLVIITATTHRRCKPGLPRSPSFSTAIVRPSSAPEPLVTPPTPLGSAVRKYHSLHAPPTRQRWAMVSEELETPSPTNITHLSAKEDGAD
ncbi:hypothetical protein LZ31DRAFT_192521 [Colletotrichum somersetense]|nr:hypothetical protein LZ31DRAFT_192521 [Colletotrichum somersetense]